MANSSEQVSNQNNAPEENAPEQNNTPENTLQDSQVQENPEAEFENEEHGSAEDQEDDGYKIGSRADPTLPTPVEFLATLELVGLEELFPQYGTENADEPWQCTICQEGIPGPEGPKDPAKKIPACKHSFHMSCLTKWIKGINKARNRCPLCRTFLCKKHKKTRRQKWEKGIDEEATSFRQDDSSFHCEAYLWLAMRVFDEYYEAETEEEGLDWRAVYDRTVLQVGGLFTKFGPEMKMSAAHEVHGENYLKSVVTKHLREIILMEMLPATTLVGNVFIAAHHFNRAVNGEEADDVESDGGHDNDGDDYEIVEEEYGQSDDGDGEENEDWDVMVRLSGSAPASSSGSSSVENGDIESEPESRPRSPTPDELMEGDEAPRTPSPGPSSDRFRRSDAPSAPSSRAHSRYHSDSGTPSRHGTTRAERRRRTEGLQHSIERGLGFGNNLSNITHLTVNNGELNRGHITNNVTNHYHYWPAANQDAGGGDVDEDAEADAQESDMEVDSEESGSEGDNEDSESDGYADWDVLNDE